MSLGDLHCERTRRILMSIARAPPREMQPVLVNRPIR